MGLLTLKVSLAACFRGKLLGTDWTKVDLLKHMRGDPVASGDDPVCAQYPSAALIVHSPTVFGGHPENRDNSASAPSQEFDEIFTYSAHVC